MISKTLKLLWIGFVLAIAGAGSVLMFLEKGIDVELYGVEGDPPKPKVGFGEIFHERFQPIATAWFERHWALRGYAVRTDNTLNDDIFRETRQGHQVVIGRGFTLFMGDDIGYVNRTDEPDETVKAARRIAKLQKRLLAEKGIVLLPMVIPSKTTLFREDIPDAFRRAGSVGMSDANVYGAYARTLREEGALFVDGRKMIVDETGSDRASRLAIYPRTARHWNVPAACREMQGAVDELRGPFPEIGSDNLDCAVRKKIDPPLTDEEFDLHRLLNTWQPKPHDVDVYELTGKPSPPSLRIPTLVVGSSFMWKFVQISRRLEAFRPQVFYYYNHLVVETEHDLVTGEVHPFTPAWREEVWTKKLIVIDQFETFLPPMCQNFLDELEKDLDR